VKFVEVASEEENHDAKGEAGSHPEKLGQKQIFATKTAQLSQDDVLFVADGL
jgi:hypothetical protein